MKYKSVLYNLYYSHVTLYQSRILDWNQFAGFFAPHNDIVSDLALLVPQSSKLQSTKENSHYYVLA